MKVAWSPAKEIKIEPVYVMSNAIVLGKGGPWLFHQNVVIIELYDGLVPPELINLPTEYLPCCLCRFSFLLLLSFLYTRQRIVLLAFHQLLNPFFFFPLFYYILFIWLNAFMTPYIFWEEVKRHIVKVNPPWHGSLGKIDIIFLLGIQDCWWGSWENLTRVIWEANHPPEGEHNKEGWTTPKTLI
jgi:hypothetical protein